jgi:hypothetical protein
MSYIACFFLISVPADLGRLWQETNGLYSRQMNNFIIQEIAKELT